MFNSKYLFTMAKGNLILGYGRGKLGDVVLYRQYGEQCSRPRNRAPKNPQTPLQLLQRVIMKTTSQAYSLMQEICDHSFQGKQVGTANQSAFAVRNVALLRGQVQSIIDAGDPVGIVTASETNYAGKATSLALINPYQVSEGSLLPLNVGFVNGVFKLKLPGVASVPAPTYQQVADALGLQQGDQLTFVVCSTDDSDDPSADNSAFNGFAFARIILEPSNGDMSAAFLNGTAVNLPNAKNEGTISLSLAVDSDEVGLAFAVGSIVAASNKSNSVAAATVIASRINGGVFQRSTQSLVVRPDSGTVTGKLTYDHHEATLGGAVQSFMTEAQSSLYLNQAESF